MKKIKITESQLKKLMGIRLTENMDSSDNGMPMLVKDVINSYLDKIELETNEEKIGDLIKFIKILIDKYPDTTKGITSRDLDAIYDVMLGRTKEDNDFDKKNPNINDKPFPDGFDFSMNEGRVTILENIASVANNEISDLGEPPLSPEDVGDIMSCGDKLEDNVPTEHKTIFRKLLELIKSADKNTLKDEFKKIKTFLKRGKQKAKVNEQLETVLILGLPVTTAVLVVIGGLLLLAILIRLVRSIPKVTTYNYRSPGCRRGLGSLFKKKQMGWRY
jgi:hypothetical protein